MISGIYLALPYVTKHSGVKKKIEAQIETFKKSDISMRYIEIESDNNYNSLLNKVIRRLPFISMMPTIKDYEVFRNIDVLYYRYYLGDLGLIRFLKKLRKTNNDLIIIIEFVDWPYIKHYFNLKDIFLLIKDILVRNFYKNYVDRAVIFTNNKMVLGINTLNAHNGIIVDNERKKKVYSSNSINLVCVSTMRDYHGYDRLICGLGKYYLANGKRHIIVHFVGNGPELIRYHDLVEKYGLNNNIIFHGEKRGHELDEIYDIADIAVTSLGLHRIGMMVGTSIKTSEYLAKGLPVVGGGKISIFETSDFKYFCEFPADESPINMEKVVSFYDEIYKTSRSHEEIVDDIRNWAYRLCDMTISMRNVTDYILEETKNRKRMKNKFNISQ